VPKTFDFQSSFILIFYSKYFGLHPMQSTITSMIGIFTINYIQVLVFYDFFHLWINNKITCDDLYFVINYPSLVKSLATIFSQGMNNP